MTHQPSILYVEDESRSRKVMQMLLKGRMGLSHVTIFEDSTDFLAQAEALSPIPDIIFLDIHVTPYDGFEMLKMFRDSADFQKSRIIALTASVMNEEVQQLQSAGFDGCLGKPIDMDTFPDTLANIMDGETVWNIIS